MVCTSVRFQIKKSNLMLETIKPVSLSLDKSLVYFIEYIKHEII